MRPAQFKYKKPEGLLQLATRGDATNPTMICAAALVIFLITQEAAGRTTAAKPEVTHSSTTIRAAGQATNFSATFYF